MRKLLEPIERGGSVLAYNEPHGEDQVHAHPGGVHPELQLVLHVHDATVTAQAGGRERRDMNGHTLPLVRANWPYGAAPQLADDALFGPGVGVRGAVGDSLDKVQIGPLHLLA